MSNWKVKAAAAIVNHEAPAAVAPVSPQAQLHAKVTGLLGEGKIAARDVDFVKSLQSGFVRYGSWTPRQLEAITRIVDNIGTVSVDAALAEQLKQALPFLARADVGFAESLLTGFARYSSFTDRQRPFVERMVNSLPRVEVVPVVASVPQIVLPKTYPNLCALVNLDKFARFTIGNLQLSLKNDGSMIWVKYNGMLAGRIDTAKQTFHGMHRGLSIEQHSLVAQMLLDIEADPEAAAKAEGIRTGRCSCCGRPLTDPTSIAIGVGPICLGKAGW